MHDFGLDDRGLRLIRGVLARHPRITEARVFGSRAKGNHRPESDVDLALFGEVDRALASLVAAELDELPLPYRFDVQAYTAIRHPPLREHIDRVGRLLFGVAYRVRPEELTADESEFSDGSGSRA